MYSMADFLHEFIFSRIVYYRSKKIYSKKKSIKSVLCAFVCTGNITTRYSWSMNPKCAPQVCTLSLNPKCAPQVWTSSVHPKYEPKVCTPSLDLKCAPQVHGKNLATTYFLCYSKNWKVSVTVVTVLTVVTVVKVVTVWKEIFCLANRILGRTCLLFAFGHKFALGQNLPWDEYVVRQ